jgi:hypothetical protein
MRVAISTARRILPKPVKSMVRPWYVRSSDFKYRMYLRRLGISKGQLLILATITKTGTHYMRFLFANYLKLLGGSSDGPVTSQEMDTMFPNGWHRAYVGPHEYNKPTPLLGLLNLHDFPRSHIEYQRQYWGGSRVLHLYRNPLDFAVSYYMYRYEYHPDLAGTVSGPVEVMERHLDEFAGMYLSYQQASRETNSRVLSICYEDLVLYPEVCFSTTLRWLGMEPQPSLINTAVQYASTHTTALIGAGEIWQRNETPPADPVKIAAFTDKLAKEGSVGQWREYFDGPDVRRVEERLKSFGIDLQEFILHH